MRSHLVSSCLEWMMVCLRLHQSAAVTGLQMVYQVEPRSITMSAASKAQQTVWCMPLMPQHAVLS